MMIELVYDLDKMMYRASCDVMGARVSYDYLPLKALEALMEKIEYYGTRAAIGVHDIRSPNAAQ